MAVGGQDANQYKPYTTISHSTTADPRGGGRTDVLKVISVPEANEMDSGQLPSIRGKVVSSNPTRFKIETLEAGFYFKELVSFTSLLPFTWVPPPGMVVQFSAAVIGTGENPRLPS